MFKKLFNGTKRIPAINEIEGKISSKISNLVTLFENRYFDYDLEMFIDKNKMTVVEQVEFIKELNERQDKEFSILKEEELKPETQAIIMELAGIQKKLNALQSKIDELKSQKVELSQPVVDALNELDLQNIRVGKILVSLYRGKTPASFSKVMDAIETQLTPAVAKLLRDTYDNLSTVRDPSLRIKSERVSEGIAEFLTSVFRRLLGGVSNALTRIEGLLGIKEEEINPHDIEKNKTAPIILGLG